MNPIRVEREIAGQKLCFETGRIAKQAGGAVFGSHGDNVVLATACTAGARPGIDFFPLTVDYREKTYAAGKFPGGFIKREGRPKDKEILTCRLIDRPLRPLFADGFKNEVQVLVTVMSADMVHDTDIVAMNSAFLATYLAPVPFNGPVAAVRVARIGGQLVACPTVKDGDTGDLDIVMAATRDAIIMVEGLAREVSEDDFLQALDFGNTVIQQILDMMVELKKKANPEPCTWTAPAVVLPECAQKAKRQMAGAMRNAVLTQGKHARYEAIDKVSSDACERFVDAKAADAEAQKAAVKGALKDLESEVMRNMILDEGLRIDRRNLKEVRKITIETDVLPRTHGSALFTRGETQAIVVTTLGTPRDQQIVDGLIEEYSKRFDLQYNFPPFSTGECKPVRGVGRREIGHGNLAERALTPVLPDDNRFPYTIRLVSEITESNGSSSMASVCGGCIALMNAGVPIAQPVAGIAMGLIKEGDRTAILTDILGTEDHLGDMDFKVAGTGRGITAVQMDIKIAGISRDLLAQALRQAREGRLHILREMIKAVPRPNAELSRHAPRLLSIQVPVDKIGMIIGPAGKNIKKIQETTGAKVEIEDTGKVIISAVEVNAAMAAKAMIEQVTAEVEVGRIYEGRVVSIKDFGCFVEVLPGQEGLCHISELDFDRVHEVTDVVKMGDVIPVKVILRDEQGRLKLSRRAALMERGGGAPPEAQGGDGERFEDAPSEERFEEGQGDAPANDEAPRGEGDGQSREGGYGDRGPRRDGPGDRRGHGDHGGGRGGYGGRGGGFGRDGGGRGRRGGGGGGGGGGFGGRGGRGGGFGGRGGHGGGRGGHGGGHGGHGGGHGHGGHGGHGGDHAPRHSD
jgi:polyribonucleotide nucleotidyltransferase